jgi:hypothetical protein
MRPEATGILQELGLPQTEVFSLEEVATFHPDAKVYLRWRTGCGRSNSRESVASIVDNLAQLRELADRGDLLTCEQCYDTLAGGASLVKDGFVYSEFVEGHSNALLRRGCCGERLLSHDGRQASLRPIQKWAARQAETYTYRPIATIDPEIAAGARAKLACLDAVERHDLVLEWMWTTTGFFFCDAHMLADPLFGDTLPQIWSADRVPVRISGLSGSPATAEGRTYVDALDCEWQPAARPGDTIVCINGALLAHYVTRAVGTGVSVIWSSGSALV